MGRVTDMVTIAAVTVYTPGFGRSQWVGAQANALRDAASHRILRDDERRGLWPSVRAAYDSLTGTDATHHLHLADDMKPCDRFLYHLTNAITARPNHAICLMTMKWQITGHARDQGSAWAVSRGSLWGGATVWPASWTPKFLEHTRQRFYPDYPHDDVRQAQFLEDTGRAQVWHTVPSLLEHAEAASSIVGHSNSRRVAAWFLTDPDYEPDWSFNLFDPPKSISSRADGVKPEELRPVWT